MSAKEKVLQTALELFNVQGALSVTTNHIAKAAGVSPGNLYYHFRNKEAIIRELYAAMSAEFVAMKSFEEIPQKPNPLLALFSAFDQYGKLFWRYRFLMRDAPVLMALDNELKAMFAANQATRIARIQALYGFFIERGILDQSLADNLPLRAKLQWFISAFWQVFASSAGEVTKESIDESKTVVFRLLIAPHLTAKGRMLMENIPGLLEERDYLNNA